MLHCDHVLYPEQLNPDCIADCAAGGAVDDAVAFWTDTLGFTVNRARALAYLRSTGAWEREELDAATDETLARRVLWLACCNFKEGETVFAMEG